MKEDKETRSVPVRERNEGRKRGRERGSKEKENRKSEAVSERVRINRGSERYRKRNEGRK